LLITSPKYIKTQFFNEKDLQKWTFERAFLSWPYISSLIKDHM